MLRLRAEENRVRGCVVCGERKVSSVDSVFDARRLLTTSRSGTQSMRHRHRV